MSSDPSLASVAAIASLDQPVRRRLHALLVERADWMTRDDAATALDLARSVAAFHLDKLAEAGIVEVSFQRPSGRTGPGAGRPSKRYRRLAEELSISVPDRRYDVAGQLLAEAVAASTSTGAPVQDCLHRVARAAGERMGVALRERGLGGGELEDQCRAVVDALESGGYEPDVDGVEIALSNCPFHRLAEEHRALVCGMNLDLLSGLANELGPPPALEAHLDPQVGYCCVRLAPAPARELLPRTD